MADSDETTALALLSAEKIANNVDLLTEILVRLPIESLIKLKSVSKDWLSLISSGRLCSRRTPHPNSASGLIMFCSCGREQCVDFIDLNGQNNNNNHAGRGPLEFLPFLENTKKNDILHSCNGLLLFRTPSPDFSNMYNIYNSQRERKFYIANPTTKQYTLLPLPLACNNYDNGGGFVFNLAYDPCKSQHSFKVVCIRRSGCITKPYQIEIYSSQTGLWELSGGFFDAPLDLDSYYHVGGGLGGVFWNGAVHWVDESDSLLYFNVEEHLLNQLPLPVVNRSNRMSWYFGESRGHLHLVETFSSRHTDLFCIESDHDHSDDDIDYDYYSFHVYPDFDIYELERDYSKWTLKFHVDLSQSVFPLLPEFDTRFKVVYVSRGEQDEDSYMVILIPGSLVVYYYKTQTLKHIISRPSTRVDFCCLYPYIESLAWLNLNPNGQF